MKVLTFVALIVFVPHFLNAQKYSYCDRGDSLYNINKYSDATYYYSLCLNMKEDTVDVYYYRGSSKFQATDFYGAMEDYKNYLGIVKGKEHARDGTRGFRIDNVQFSYFAMAVIFLEWRDKQSACLCFRKASEFGHPDVRQDIEKYCK